MPRFLVSMPGEPPVEVDLRDGMTLGRHEGCEVHIRDAKASRSHARVAIVDGAWVIRDLGSTHGTVVNGGRVAEAILGDGDQVQIGQAVLRFVAGEAQPDVLCALATVEAPPGRGSDQRLRLLYDVAGALAELDDPDAALGRMLEGIVDVLGAERGAVGLCEGGSVRVVSRLRCGAAPSRIVVGRAVLDPILRERRSLLVQEPPRDGTLAREQVLSAMGAPLLFGGKVLGYVYVDDRAHAGRFAQDDLEFLAALAHLTAAALVSAERMQRATLGAGQEGPEAVAAIIGEGPPMLRLKAEIRRFAAAGTNVLVRGESGTGKELVARALHALSPRAHRPLVTLNCAALPETMVESELFGFEKGSFTGATRDKRGKFALANGGTLFLDEIGDLALPAQAKLLRAIQEGEIQPLGGERALKVDVRVVAATHRDLTAEIAAGRFREDLYYRLAVVELVSPPLRERGDDVVLLARTLLGRAASRTGKPLTGFAPEALAAIRRYPWPGNVRELQNEVERAAILAQGGLVEIDELSLKLQAAIPDPVAAALPQQPRDATLAAHFAALEPAERALVEKALGLARGNVSEAARILGITRIMMKRRVDRFGLRAGGEDEA